MKDLHLEKLVFDKKHWLDNSYMPYVIRNLIENCNAIGFKIPICAGLTTTILIIMLNLFQIYLYLRTQK